MKDFDQDKEKFEFRLERYYSAVDISGLITPLLVGAVILFFPSLFPWLDYRVPTLLFFLAIIIVNAADLYLYKRYRKKIFFHINRYAFIALFMEFIVASGGIHSEYLFLLLFPVIVSAVDLDPHMTRRVGVVICIFLAVLIVITPGEILSPVALMNDCLRLAMFIILSSYMYIIVRETLRQKYERDEASRRFTRLVEVENLKSDFLSVAQHQLRTPLSGIRYALESLRSEGTLAPADKELIESGIIRIGDAIGIVNQMLTAAETGGENLALRRFPTDLSAMIHGLIEELSYVASQKEIAVRADLAPHVTVSMDTQRLKPALANIIDNSFKYSPHGHVTITLSADDTWATLSVMDTGVGISQDDIGFIFNRFYRGKNAIALEPDQSGVGLYTAKRMIELHGGSISIESTLGKGTTVTVRLPKEIPH